LAVSFRRTSVQGKNASFLCRRLGFQRPPSHDRAAPSGRKFFFQPAAASATWS